MKLTPEDQAAYAYVQDPSADHSDVVLLELTIHRTPFRPSAYHGYVAFDVILDTVEARQCSSLCIDISFSPLLATDYESLLERRAPLPVMVSSHSLPEIGHAIQSYASSIHDLLDASNLPQPSFSLGVPPRLTPYHAAIEDQRTKLLQAPDELKALVLGPNAYILSTAVLSPAWTATFNVLYRFRIAHHVPLDGALSYADLAQRCGLNEFDARRFIRAAISLHIFEESPVGHVRHNANSAALVSTLVHDSIGFATEEYAPAALKTSESLQRFPGSDRPEESPVAIANRITGERDIFTEISQDEARVARVANTMAWLMSAPENLPEHFVNSVPWSSSSLQECPRVVVDVGGSHGHLSEALLSKYPGIEKAIVEDQPEVTRKNIENRALKKEDLLGGRLQYQAYDFFTEQVIKDADVYIFRSVVHDWPDRLAVQILRNQVPALRQGAKILINDICMKDPRGIHSQLAYATDIMAMMAANAKERSREEWTELVATADKRFEIVSIISPPHSKLSTIEIVCEAIDLPLGQDKQYRVTEKGAGAPYPKGSTLARDISPPAPPSQGKCESKAPRKRLRLRRHGDHDDSSFRLKQLSFGYRVLRERAVVRDSIKKVPGGGFVGDGALSVPSQLCLLGKYRITALYARERLPSSDVTGCLPISNTTHETLLGCVPAGWVGSQQGLQASPVTHPRLLIARDWPFADGKAGYESSCLPPRP
ncbi:hypothetical protein DL766_010442 [Monosporascus sp. MC13-8B]|uniref:O-methyltransferase C-terminal domain-containing protein n=1 Tax=Monosporascus cannonballus TaxID=155416 RepID=A0ABY0GZC7_9PEZI|nr:hypothetical protein DL762_007418 [Monosporascus cannonballus]RYO84221.1 hypothetical protein DL763_007545 [Monosporascus cannonballus]RYP01796.1 hypothetical protein DL766_010442 [Monosporascus sp. MC13-8B]